MGRAHEVRAASMAKTAAAKSKLNNKWSRIIYMAAKSGVPDPDLNQNLKKEIEKAKREQVTADVIKRAIEKAKGANLESYDSMVLEGFGPGNSMFVIECLTDNHNRTQTSVKVALQKCGGKIAGSGSVTHMFKNTAIFSIDFMNEEETLEALLLADCEVEDISSDDDVVTITAPRLDDVMCAYSCMNALIDSDESNQESVAVCAVFDNEEVGSSTKQGADSTFLSDVLMRIASCAGKDNEDYIRACAGSFMLSADNAHAVHPNYQEKADPTNRPHMNKGIVIKYNANQKYTTDAVSAAIFKEICTRAGVPTQEFANRSDIPGGSTLGNIANCHVSMNTVDIGLAQLAMHSPYETAGIMDTEYMIKAVKEFFETAIVTNSNGTFTLE